MSILRFEFDVTEEDEILDALDFETPEQCQIKVPHTCPREVTLHIVCRGCGVSVPGCGKCTAGLLRYVADRMEETPGYISRCPRCDLQSWNWYVVHSVVYLDGTVVL